MTGQKEALITAVLLDVAELPDRTSPEDWPEAMLVTGEELDLILRRHLADALEPLLGASERVGAGDRIKRLLQLALDEMQSMIEAVNANDDTRYLKYSTPYGAMVGMVNVREAILEQCAKWGIEVSPHRKPQPPGAPEGGWRDIESAPRDGTPVDLWSAERGERIADAWWSGTAKLRKNEDHRWHAPNQDYDGDSGWIGNGLRITHWQPLPESPDDR